MVEKAIKSTSKRIVAFDQLRGFLLLIILINHIELYPSIYDVFTGRGRLFVSAAEGFFFMSGLLVGVVYKRRLALGMRFITKKMWRRAVELYIPSVLLTMLFTYWALASHHTAIKDGLLVNTPWPTIIQKTLLLQYWFGWADFLVHYAMFMFFAPLMFWLLVKRKWWLVLLISLAVWEVRGGSFGRAWQILFYGGMVVGYYWQQITDWFHSLQAPMQRTLKYGVLIASGLTLLVSYGSVYALSQLNQHLATLPHNWQQFTYHWNDANEFMWRYFEKWTMGPGRIALFLLWFAAAFIIVRRYERQIDKYTRGIVTLLGQNSLFVYVTHAFIIITFKIYLIPPTTSLWANFVITTSAMAILIAITLAYKKYWPGILATLKDSLSPGKTKTHRPSAKHQAATKTS